MDDSPNHQGQTMNSQGHSSHIPVVYRGVAMMGAMSFLIAAITGIWRIALTRGFLLPPIPEWWPPHGHWMLGGFLAALILFERIIAFRADWLVWVPYAYVLSALFLHTGSPIALAIHLLSLTGWIVHRWLAYRKFHKYEKPLIESVAYITLSSALIHPGGMTADPVVALSALSFPAATILVERLELSLTFRKTGARITLWILVMWCVLWILSSWFHLVPLSWMGLLTLFLAIGCIAYDKPLWTPTGSAKLYSFFRWSLTTGYMWFLAFAIAMIVSSHLPGAVMKDVWFHLIGLGFIFTMILAHAPLILPSVIGKSPPESVPQFLFWAFQLWTLVRVIADLLVAKSLLLWTWTGWITGALHMATFILYMALVARSIHKNGAGFVVKP